MVGTWPGVDVRRLAALIGAAVLLACAAPRAEAAPVDPTARLELTQPDGSTVVARGYGDEWLHGLETVDGFTLLRDAASGYWEYARPQPAGTLAPSGLRPGVDLPAGLRRGARDAVAVEDASDARAATRSRSRSRTAPPPTAG